MTRVSSPLPKEIETMTTHDLLFILAAADPGAAFRTWAHRQKGESTFDEELDSAVPPDLDPLRRYNLQETFLRRVRRQARQLASVKEKLETPVWSEQALTWRLTGILGVERLVQRLLRDMKENPKNPAETVLSLSDVMLTLSEVQYRECDGALTKRQFDKVYKPFLKHLADDINMRFRASGPQIFSDVSQFWTRVYERCRK